MGDHRSWQDWCTPVCTPDREWQRQGDATLCTRLRAQGKGGASLEHQAAERIGRLEAALRYIMETDTLEHARSWARSELSHE